MNACIRSNLSDRFTNAGLIVQRLSRSTPISSPFEPHIPILTTTNLFTASRVLVYFGESCQDLGVLAYRTIGISSLASGSIINLISAIRAREAPSSTNKVEETAIVIANPGQLIWYRRGARAVTSVSWKMLPRKTATDPSMVIDEARNRVQGHKDKEEHLRSVMTFVKGHINDGAKLEIIAAGDGVAAVVNFLDEDWNEWGGRVSAICACLDLASGMVDYIRDKEFRDFWSKVYTIHPHLSSPNQDH